MRRSLCVLALTGLLLGGAGEAPKPEVNPASLAAAHELLGVMNAQANVLTMLTNLRGVMVQNIVRQSHKPEAEVGAIVDDVIMPEIRARIGEFTDGLAQAQASVYTIDEMHQLVAFYKTPLGQRVVEATPKIAALSYAVGQEWGKRVALDALRKHAEELRRRGVNL